MKRRNAGREKNRPLYSCDKKKNRNRAKSGKLIEVGTILVESKAELMSEIAVE